MAPRFTLPALVAAVAVAGCGSSNAPSATTTPTRYQQTLAFSQCMRAHGVTNFPDPTSGGGLMIRGGPGSSFDPSSPVFKTAQQACHSKLPKGAGAPLSASRRQAMLQFSRCMRSHGVPAFPDPTFSGGGVRIQLQKGSGVDPSSPAFKQAQQTCLRLVPGALPAP